MVSLPTAEQRDFFLENGYIVIKHAFTREQTEDFTKEMWVRLGMDPEDKSTWNSDKVNMPVMKKVRVDEFAPKVCYIRSTL